MKNQISRILLGLLICAGIDYAIFRIVLPIIERSAWEDPLICMGNIFISMWAICMAPYYVAQIIGVSRCH